MGKMGTGRKTYPAAPSDYKLLEEVGFGASATVYRGICVPLNEVVAVKCLDLDRCASNLDEIRREAQTMSLIDHPNVISAYCSFVVEHQLWVVMPFMAEGSCLHLMKVSYPEGFEEDIIGSILKETLKALEYLHRHGHIHRDVKAGNILLDSNGVVKLGDFGVSACMFDNGDRQCVRNTFTGTPCWMAPEVLQPGSGYDFRADIWSFGITALELAHGHAPFSKYPPMKVLLMTIQNAPPGLDYDRDRRFSKSFKEMVAMCLVKDPTKRPTAEKLLKHSFFKHAKPVQLSVKHILADLPPLWDRVKALQLKDAAQLALRRMPSAEEEAISQSEYKRGVSAWNFDLEDLKAQAALVQDNDLTGMKEKDGSSKQLPNAKVAALSGPLMWNSMPVNEIDVRSSNKSTEWPDILGVKEEIREGVSHDFLNQDKPRKHDTNEADDPVSLAPSEDLNHGYFKIEAAKDPQSLGGLHMPSRTLCHSFLETETINERGDGEWQPPNDQCRRVTRKMGSFNGPLMLSNRASANSVSAPIRSSGVSKDSLEDKSKVNVVQVGRFSVTSGTVDLVKDIPPCTVSRRSSQVSSLRKSASVDDWLAESRSLLNIPPPMEVSNCAIPTSFIMPQLHNLLQQTAFQQDLILTLLNSLRQIEVVDVPECAIFPSQAQSSENGDLAEMGITEREWVLLNKISELQSRMTTLTDELTAARSKCVELQQQLFTSNGGEVDNS